MSATTIQIPAEHVEAVRQGLIDRREGAGLGEEVDRLLEQIAGPAPTASAPYALTGSRVVLWGAVYDALCVAAEKLADDCNEYWRGVVDPDVARAGISDVSARLELLVGLGAPPVG